MKQDIGIGKKTFQVSIDIDLAKEEILRIREEEGFCKVYTAEVSTQEQIDGDCDSMQAIFDGFVENPGTLVNIVEDQPKKANGTFRKKGVNILYNAKYTSTLWEDSFCYATYAVRAKAISDIELVILIDIERNTW